MLIEAREDRHVSRDDFRAEVDDDRALIVPAEVGRILDAMHIRTAERFVSALYTSPGAFARALSWAASDVKLARDGLIQKLRGHIDSTILDFQPGAFVRGTGAFPPPADGPAPYNRRAQGDDS